ncbi:MAG TPA: hypothetical protein VFY49_18565 [Myxococcota bacterium]|nr:hypothetical protein [Myxococcota bacterium]
MRTGKKSWTCGLLLGALALPLSASAADGALGEVTSVSGQATAAREGGTPRNLACGDSVYPGETVTTTQGSSVGMLLGADLLAQVGENSAVRLGTTPAGTADATLQKGSVRVIDARASGAAPARLAAGTAAARIDGGDSEAYVLAEKAGGYSMFCEWDSPLAVTRGSETRTASPRQCVIAKPDEPLYLADAHQDRLAALEDSCAPANFAALGPHFPAIAARDVAAGPAPFSVSPAELPGLERQACEDPGAACPTIRIDEEPPGGGGFPGENP